MAENTGKKVQISFYGTEQLRLDLQEAALERSRASGRRVTVQELIGQAIAREFSGTEKTPENCKATGLGTVPIGTLGGRQQFAEGSEGLHMMLDFVYESGPPKLVNALESTLDAFANATQLHIEHGITRTQAASDDEETDSLISEAREVTARAERSISSEDEAGNGDSNGEDASHADYPWRKRA